MLRRRAFNTLVVVSLLVSVATISLWIRSYYAWDTVSVPWPKCGTGIGFYSGQVIALVQLTDPIVSGIEDWSWQAHAPGGWSGLHFVENPLPNLSFRQRYEHFLVEAYETDPGLQIRPDNEGSIAEVMYVLPGARPVVGDRFLRIHVPHWFVASITLLPGWVWMAVRVRRSILRRRASRIGRCVRCGYDIRANCGRCSECGEPLPAATHALAE
jgi:hypothetical protein